MLDQQELMDYFESKFDPAYTHWNDRLWEKDAARYKTADEYRRKSKALIYKQVQTWASSWRAPYFDFVQEVTPSVKALDYHCGVGAVGLWLRRYGYQMDFAGPKSECTKFLRWRLERRGVEAQVYDQDKDDIPRYPLVVCFEALHTYPSEQQFGLVQKLARLGEVVIVNLNTRNVVNLSTRPYEQERFCFPVDVAGLYEQIEQDYSIVGHRVSNVYAHLVAFRTPRPSSATETAPAREEVRDG